MLHWIDDYVFWFFLSLTSNSLHTPTHTLIIYEPSNLFSSTESYIYSYTSTLQSIHSCITVEYLIVHGHSHSQFAFYLIPVLHNHNYKPHFVRTNNLHLQFYRIQLLWMLSFEFIPVVQEDKGVPRCRCYYSRSSRCFIHQSAFM